MKILLLIMMMLVSFTPQSLSSSVMSDKYNNYISSVNEYYDDYKVSYYEKNNFIFAIIEGECNDELSFGVFLSSMESGSYTVKIFIEEREYSLPKDSRSDTVTYCVKHPDEETRICVYDVVGDTSTMRLEHYLVYETKEEYDIADSKIDGRDVGCSLTSMVREYSLTSILLIIVIACIGVAGLCFGVILYLFRTKKGMFNKERNKDNDHKFFIMDEDGNNHNREKDDVEEIDEEPKEVYEKKYYYDDEEEFDFKPYLLEKGYKTNYKEMTEEEKNQVMVYLMTLRHLNKITEKQCQEEAIKLWKK